MSVVWVGAFIITKNIKESERKQHILDLTLIYVYFACLVIISHTLLGNSNIASAMNENQWDVNLLNKIVTSKGHSHLTLRGGSPWWSETYQCLIGDSLRHPVSKNWAIPYTVNELPGLQMSETQTLAFTSTQMLQHLPFLIYNALYRTTLGKLNNIGPKGAFQIVKDAMENRNRAPG